MQTCLDDTGNKIVREIYKAVNAQAVDPILLTVIDLMIAWEID